MSKSAFSIRQHFSRLIQYIWVLTISDVGICSIIKPQLNFNESLEQFPYWHKLFFMNYLVKPGSEVGKANGLTVLLDAETFDYTYHLRAGEGMYLRCTRFDEFIP